MRALQDLKTIGLVLQPKTLSRYAQVLDVELQFASRNPATSGSAAKILPLITTITQDGPKHTR